MTERRHPSDNVWKAASLVLALGGLAGFILIFVRHMNVYWFILSPIILSLYVDTVYGRFHYVTDVATGIAAGVLAVAVSRRMGNKRRRMGGPDPAISSPPAEADCAS